MDKPALRAHLLERRNAASVADPDAGARLTSVFLNTFPLAAGTCVAGYVPMRGEMDVMPLLRALAGQGHALALPVVLGADKPLLFRHWAEGEPLEPGRWGTVHPADTAPVAAPALYLVPLLGFDRQGNRLGYGGGMYDRTLPVARAERPIIALGVAFAMQEVDALPAEAHDARLEGMITERELISF